jgi:hypothetical protein
MSMRAVLAMLVLAGCAERDPGDYNLPPDNTDPSSYGCHQDSDCAPNVCARNHVCLPADEVRPVTVTWTVAGAAADATTCSSGPDLNLRFYQGGSSEWFGYSPVPCAEGRFFIDKLPLIYVTAELEIQHTGTWASSPIDATGAASLDLQ